MEVFGPAIDLKNSILLLIEESSKPVIGMTRWIFRFFIGIE